MPINYNLATQLRKRHENLGYFYVLYYCIIFIFFLPPNGGLVMRKAPFHIKCSMQYPSSFAVRDSGRYMTTSPPRPRYDRYLCAPLPYMRGVEFEVCRQARQDLIFGYLIHPHLRKQTGTTGSIPETRGGNNAIHARNNFLHVLPKLILDTGSLFFLLSITVVSESLKKID
ncbi:hypothetical protein F5Y09DRAFT_62877 [Xylaria sp. FL1042]|nr:hypothetical protein F5Y09DRAFT_62877 [Xylaria sp. FL1042]